MYFYRKVSDSGATLQLLASYRNAEGASRHRVVLSLGQSAIPEISWDRIAKGVEQRLMGIQELITETSTVEEQRWIDQIARRVDREGRWHNIPDESKPIIKLEARDVIADVRLTDVTHTHTTSLGPALLGWHAWRELGLPGCLRECGFNDAQVQAAAVAVINRLVDPVSEHRLRDWLPNSSLPELLGTAVEGGGQDRYYRVSDKLLEHQKRIEKHLLDRQGQLHNLDRTILLYDLTNSHFEGVGAGNPKARRGKNKQGRDDCVQIVIGMVFDRQGFELTHRVFAGNRHDGKSLADMVDALQAVLPNDELPAQRERPLVIVDGGVANRQNLKLLKSKGFSYLVNDTRRRRAAYRDEFLAAQAWERLPGWEGRPEVKVKSLVDPEGPAEEADQLVLCCSAGRRHKEVAIRSKAEERYLQQLENLAKRITSGRLKDSAAIQRALGRLQGKYTRVQRFYTVEVNTVSSPAVLTWHRRQEAWQADDELMGCYVLRTDRRGLTAESLWELYITLTRAEDGFKALKSDLGLRPNYHQLEPRVEAHVFITVLAYQLLRSLLYRLEQKNDTRGWETIKRVVQTHAYTTIELPATDGKLYRLRKAGRPEEQQVAIYETLGIDWRNLPAPQSEVSVKK